MSTVKFDKNRTIFQEGDEGNTMFAIRSGRVGIFAAHGKAGERMLEELGVGDAFGVTAVFNPEIRTSTAVALEDDTVLAEITADEFDDYLKKHPETFKQILKRMNQQIHSLSSDHADVLKRIEDVQASAVEKQHSELDDRLQEIVSIYKSRYPGLFSIATKEAKDEVKFIFDASKSNQDKY